MANTVLLDTLGTTGSTGNSTATTLAGTGTVTDGHDRALLVIAGFDLSTVSSITGVWDPAGSNQSLTQIVTANLNGTNGQIGIWGLLNPSIGTSKPVRFNWTTASGASIQVVSFTGVYQHAFSEAFIAATSATGSSSSSSITINSVTNNATLDCTVASTAFSAPTQTQVAIDNSLPIVSVASSRANGAATVTHAWTLAVSNSWLSIGINIVASGIGGTLRRYDGVGWRTSCMEFYTGSAWDKGGGLKRWDGQQWLLINNTAGRDT